MQKLYNLVKVSALLLLLLIQNSLQAQNSCSDCQADVKVVTDKQVLLDKIEIKDGIATKLNTNLYVSYRSGNIQKFWANLAIATAGVVVSSQLQHNSTAEGSNVNGISPLIPLGVSVATLPSIWKNRPRGVPQAGLWLQHRDTRGRLTDTWEQPISSEAKNSGELLSVNIDKPLSAGTVEVYLQNGSKNPVYYWGYQSSKSIVEKKALLPKTPPVSNSVGCPSGYLPNGNGMCCNFFNGECIPEGVDDGNPPPPPPAPQGCPAGYLPNGQGMCCSPITGQCVSEGSNPGLPPNNDNNNPRPNPTPIPTINLQNVAQGCPSGFLSNGSGMCCNPFTGNCISEKAIHDPTNSNFVSSFAQSNSTKPPCAIWVCTTTTRVMTVRFAGEGNVTECGWLEYQCPTGPPGNPFPDPTPATPVNCGSGFHFDGTFCVPDNPYSGNSPFYPVTGGTTGTGGSSGSGNGGNNGSTNGGCPVGTFRNTITGACEVIPTLPTMYNRPERRSEIYDNQCAGLKAMWDYSYRWNDPFATKELNGFITTNGKVIILPSYDNSPSNCSWKGSYADEQGREIVRVTTDNGLTYVITKNYNSDGTLSSNEYIAASTIHTHPFSGPDVLHPGTVWDTYNPGPNDIGFVNSPDNSNLNHFILTNEKIIQYNSSGVLNTTPNTCH